MSLHIFFYGYMLFFFFFVIIFCMFFIFLYVLKIYVCVCVGISLDLRPVCVWARQEFSDLHGFLRDEDALNTLVLGGGFVQLANAEAERLRRQRPQLFR